MKMDEMKLIQALDDAQVSKTALLREMDKRGEEGVGYTVALAEEQVYARLATIFRKATSVEPEETPPSAERQKPFGTILCPDCERRYKSENYIDHECPAHWAGQANAAVALIVSGGALVVLGLILVGLAQL